MSGKTLMLFAPSAYPLGGVATWAGYLLPGLRERGWRPVLALTQGRFHDPAAYLSVHPFSPAVVVPCGAGTQASRVSHAAHAIARARPHIVAVVNLPDVTLAAQRLRRRGAFAGKVVLIEHGLDCEALIGLREFEGSLDAFVGTNRLACALASRFTGMASARVFYAPYGVDAAGRAVRPETSEPRRLKLLYAGRLESAQKRVQDLPVLADELARRRVAFALVIAGGGPEEAALRRRFAATPHEVEFLGAVPQPQLCQRVFAEVDALVVLSTWETGPIVAYEAMAAGLPVVTSRFTGSAAEGALVDGVNCLMFPIGDMRGAADAILRLQAPGHAARLAAAGRELVASRYSRAASIARWDEAFREILRLPPLPPNVGHESLQISGRLDRWLGPRTGDLIRGALGLAYRHAEPGGEWPHLSARSDADAAAFDAFIAACESGASA